MWMSLCTLLRLDAFQIADALAARGCALACSKETHVPREVSRRKGCLARGHKITSRGHADLPPEGLGPWPMGRHCRRELRVAGTLASEIT